MFNKYRLNTSLHQIGNVSDQDLSPQMFSVSFHGLQNGDTIHLFIHAL